MEFKGKIYLLLVAIGTVSLAGCEAPSGGRYNNAVYDAPNYDSIGYSPKYTPEFYNSSYYASDLYMQRPYY